MRFRFTIRDLLWLTFLAALFAGWWADHHKWTGFYREAADRATRLAKERDEMEQITNNERRLLRLQERQLQQTQSAKNP